MNTLEWHKKRNKYKGCRNDLTEEDWQFLLDLAHGHCLSCGVPFNLYDEMKYMPTPDHVYSGRDGLKDGLTLRNIQPLCFGCNSKKGDRFNHDYRTFEMLLLVWKRILKQKKIKYVEKKQTYMLLFDGVFDPLKLRPNGKAKKQKRKSLDKGNTVRKTKTPRKKKKDIPAVRKKTAVKSKKTGRAVK